MTNPKDPTQQRLEVLERTVDNLRWHLLNTLEQSYALAAELAQFKGVKQDQDPICTKLLAEFTTLNTLRPIRRDFNRKP